MESNMSVVMNHTGDWESPAGMPASPLLGLLIDEVPLAVAYMIIPAALLYISIYAYLKGLHKVYNVLTLLSLAAFWFAPMASPITCSPVRSLQNFAIAIGSMKLLDVWARQNSFPTYHAGPRPQDWKLALIMLTELRYESFTPNQIRVPKNQENFNEALQLGLGIGAFALLQSLPQNFPVILAFEVLLSVNIIFSSMQLVLRYKTSPALFGPLYLADSLTGFWSETWHNTFAAPCASLAYGPLRNQLPKYGVPVPIARSLGVFGAFSLMGFFHVYAIAPIANTEALTRIGLFFFLNGVGTVFEAMIWGKKRHWVKVVLAWSFEVVLASWTASAMNLPSGLSKIMWSNVCYVPGY